MPHEHLKIICFLMQYTLSTISKFAESIFNEGGRGKGIFYNTFVSEERKFISIRLSAIEAEHDAQLTITLLSINSGVKTITKIVSDKKYKICFVCELRPKNCEQM